MSLFGELKRRNVFRVAIAYAVLSWVMAQVAELLLDAFGAPDWALKSLLALFLVGFPFVVFFSWVYELTPEGVKREEDVDRSNSVTGQTGRKLDRLIIIVLLIALAGFAWDRFRVKDEAGLDAGVAAQAEAPGSTATQGSSTALPVIAVLPFKASGSNDGGFLAAGLHDDLLTRLAKLGAFRVISRTSMMEYASTSKNMRRIGEELGAGYILEGGVQAIDQRVRVNAQLIDAAADQHVWAEVYDRDLTAANLFDIQSELAVAIARELKTELSAADMDLVGDVPTENIEAYQAYLRGIQLSESSGYIGTKRDSEAVQAFEQAVALDPDFAVAWALLARARVRASCCRFGKDQAAEVLEALARARALKPGMLESELAWVEYLYRFDSEYQQGLDALASLNDQVSGNYNALLLRAYLQRRLGQFRTAYETLQKARVLAPRNPGVYIHLTDFAQDIGDCAAAKQHADELQVLAPEEPAVQVSLAEFELECTGDAKRAVELTKGLDFSGIGGFFSAVWAAFMARDAEQSLALLLAPMPPDPPADILLFQQLNLAWHYRYLEPDESRLAAALDEAARLLESADDEYKASEGFAAKQREYWALMGNAQETRQWTEEHRQRFRRQHKGDVSIEAKNHLYYALDLAEAGLLDEAVEELRIMLEQPGGHRFPYFDGAPVFDVLMDHPSYQALRARFGN